MEILYKIFIDPFVQMGGAPDLLIQTLWEGLVSGVLYALIALGFVLIFKASGVFNFAQGIMVVFAALTLVGLHAKGIPAFVALALTIVVMLVLAIGVERLMLRPLVNQPDIILFMATFGLTYFLIGLGEIIFGGEPKVMIASELGLPKGALEWKVFGGYRVVPEDRHRRRHHRLDHGGDACGVLPEDPHRARAARGRRQPQGGALGRHFARADLGDRVVRGRHRRARHRHHVGRALGRVVRAADSGAEGAAGADPRRLHLDSGRDRRRRHHRGRREARRILLGSAARLAASRAGSPT